MQRDNIKDFFHFITRFGKSEWYLVPSILLFWYFKINLKKNEAKRAIYIFWVNVIAGLGVIFIKFIFGRARPKMFFEESCYGFNWFEVSHKLTSFPSGHTITVFSTAFAMGYLFPKYKYIFLIFATLVAFSRVIGTNHFVSDVIFSVYLGYMVATVLYRRMFK
jgi:membrane-associated phospholipid phosphatase